MAGGGVGKIKIRRGKKKVKIIVHSREKSEYKSNIFESFAMHRRERKIGNINIALVPLLLELSVHLKCSCLGNRKKLSKDTKLFISCRKAKYARL